MTQWDPDIVWDVSHFKNWPESSYRGADRVRKFLAEWQEMWGEYEIDIEEIKPAPDGRVVTLFTQRGKGQAEEWLQTIRSRLRRLGAEDR